MKFTAYITTYPGTGRPNAPRVRAGDCADAMSEYNGYAPVGVYDTREEAQIAVDQAWDEWTETDDRGFVQWKDQA